MSKASEIVEDLMGEVSKPKSAVQKEEFMKKKLADLSKEKKMRLNLSKTVHDRLKDFMTVQKKFNPYKMTQNLMKMKMNKTHMDAWANKFKDSKTIGKMPPIPKIKLPKFPSFANF